MTATIYIEPLLIQPVIAGEWHRTRLTEIPAPGQVITMLCGVSDAVAFKLSDERRQRRILRQCERCDVVYRREQGIPLRQDRTGRS